MPDASSGKADFDAGSIGPSIGCLEGPASFDNGLTTAVFAAVGNMLFEVSFCGLNEHGSDSGTWGTPLSRSQIPLMVPICLGGGGVQAVWPPISLFTSRRGLTSSIVYPEDDKDMRLSLQRVKGRFRLLFHARDEVEREEVLRQYSLCTSFSKAQLR